jgi:RNA polymerase sigma-70 factor (ECF subfamily)
VNIEQLGALTDDELVELARVQSDPFGILYDRHVRRIYGYIYYRVGRVADAEDLTERVFFQALENIGRYEVRGVPFSAWLFRIAHNLVANWHRDQERHPATPIDDAEHLEDRAADPPGHAIGDEEKRNLRSIIAGLPADRQTVLFMKFVEDRSNSEIAQTLRRTEGAVKALLHRTIVVLRNQMAESEVRSP